MKQIWLVCSFFHFFFWMFFSLKKRICKQCCADWNPGWFCCVGCDSGTFVPLFLASAVGCWTSEGCDFDNHQVDLGFSSQVVEECDQHCDFCCCECEQHYKPHLNSSRLKTKNNLSFLKYIYIYLFLFRSWFSVGQTYQVLIPLITSLQKTKTEKKQKDDWKK